jgi:hypothetical protein
LGSNNHFSELAQKVNLEEEDADEVKKTGEGDKKKRFQREEEEHALRLWAEATTERCGRSSWKVSSIISLGTPHAAQLSAVTASTHDNNYAHSTLLAHLTSFLSLFSLFYIPSRGMHK